MKILFVCPATSLHTVRWIKQIENAGFDVHVFPVEPYALHPGFRELTLHNPVFTRRPFDDYDLHKLGVLGRPLPPKGWWGSLWRDRSFDLSVRQRGLWWPFRRGPEGIEARLARLAPEKLSRAASLARTIRRLRPDVVHSLEVITGGYLALDARALSDGVFPPWIVSNWGCDLHFFGQLAEHEAKIRKVMTLCDYYSAECERDVKLARDFGFTGRALPVRPNASVFELDRVLRMRQPGPASRRRLILLKGYQDWHGRALVALRALEMVTEILAGYRIVIFLASPPVRMAAELMGKRTGIPVEFVPFSAHDDIMRLHGQARISIGVGISDGIPSSLLEAMAMGSFPIQSDTSCAAEWITHGQTGMLIPGEDTGATAEALRLALSDDGMVDRAAVLNGEIARERLDLAQACPDVVNTYRGIIKGTSTERGSIDPHAEAVTEHGGSREPVLDSAQGT
jgi:glycosyltransferase involved in cell wall biosynthesis